LKDGDSWFPMVPYRDSDSQFIESQSISIQVLWLVDCQTELIVGIALLVIREHVERPKGGGGNQVVVYWATCSCLSLQIVEKHSTTLLQTGSLVAEKSFKNKKSILKTSFVNNK